MRLQSRLKIAHGRCAEPAETISRLEALLEPRASYWLHHESVSESLHWAAMFIEDQPDFRSMGKGVTAELSHAGALAEGAEWLTSRDTASLPGYLAAHQSEVPNPLRISSLLEHVATATPPVLQRVCALDEAKHWVTGYSLLEDEPREIQVPLEYVRLISGPNGKASGNFLEEAIVHATNEIFERRAHITVLRNRLVVPTIDASTIDHPVLREQIRFLCSLGIEIILKDLSFGGVLPCVGAYFVDPNIPADSQFRHFFKVGASFDREEALLRTFTEFVQGRKREEFVDLESIRKTQGEAAATESLKQLLAADFRNLRTQDEDCDNFLSSFMFGMVPYRNADFLREGERVAFDKGTRYEDCLDDIDHARSICEALNKNYIAVDLTDPEIGFPVVQVVIPGYSDVLPFHPVTSPALFRQARRSEVIAAYLAP